MSSVHRVDSVDFREPILAYAWTEPPVEWPCPLRAFRHCVVVEMCGKPDRIGSLYVAYEGQRLGPDVGVVLSAGSDAAAELSPGDVVLVNHSHGKHMDGLRIGRTVFENEVRLYGCAAMVGGKSRPVPWYKSVMAVVEKCGAVRATGRNVVIDRGDVRTVTEGGIHLPDDATFRPSIGTVVSVGPAANPEIRPGMRVVYMASLVKRVEGVRKNLGIVPSEAVLAEVCDGEHD